MNKLHTSLAAVAVATGLTGQAFATPVSDIASGSVAVLPSGSQVFNTLLLDPNANRSNYMVFNLAQLAAQLGGQQVGSATLTITNPGTYATGNPSETYALWDFSGDVNALRNYGFSTPPANDTIGTAVRDDLRGGTSYGGVVVNAPAGGAGSLAPVSITLNAAGIAALNSALGSAAQFFAIGGYADIQTNPPGAPGHYLFNSSTGSGSFGAGNATLDVQPVPLPAAIWLLGSGLAGLGANARRRRKLAVAA